MIPHLLHYMWFYMLFRNTLLQVVNLPDNSPLYGFHTVQTKYDPDIYILPTVYQIA